MKLLIDTERARSEEAAARDQQTRTIQDLADEKALLQGRYEGAVKANEELKREADYQQGRAATFDWWLKDSQKRNRDLHLRLMQAHIEIAALKDGIDALAAELEVWYWH